MTALSAFSLTQFLPGPTLNFLSAATIPTAIAGTTQKVLVETGITYGTGASPAANLFLAICYRPTGGIVTAWGTTAQTIYAQLAANTFSTYSLRAVITGLPAGTYTFGICGLATSGGANWAISGGSDIALLVMN